MSKGYLCMILHAHLPYVRHPEHENFLEEKWLFEAITETYMPLINAFERLVDEGVPFKITMSLSPTLISMLTDGLLQDRYHKHLNKLIELADKEAGRTYNTSFHQSALMYQNQFNHSRDTFYRYGGNLVNAFKKFQELDRLEIMTCATTHGFLPLMMNNKNAVRAQIRTAVNLHSKHLGRHPEGIWLPECAYTPGIDPILKEQGLKYFILDTHGLLFASHRPRYGVYAPIFCPSGVAAFGRDTESSKQVWSSNEGYPGDFDYREFYRDIGFDLDFEYVKPYIHPDGIRIHTGIKHYRITGKADYKEAYIPSNAREKAAIHAGNFMFNRKLQIDYISSIMDRPPIIVAPYDAELFGHWWYEGPLWLEMLMKKIHFDQNTFSMITPAEYLKRHGYNQVATPCASSWGHKGYNEVWLCAKNDWIYKHLHVASGRMVELAENLYHAAGIQVRALNQAARELMLAQSSDWAFIMNTGTMTDYAIRRTKTHLDNFIRLYYEIKENRIDEGWLNYLESKNNIFPEIDFKSYADRPVA